MLVRNPNDFKCIKLGVASPEMIRFWSHGEVKKPETINYRTFKPERNGLFCEKIFGPQKDWECSCGKYRRVRYRGIVCERCGVEVTHSKVRRERMGHIELATPVTHIWFLKGVPSYIGLMLDLQYKNLERVVYYESYMVTKVDESISDQLKITDLLSEEEYYACKDKYKNKFQAEMGAQAVKDVLANIDLERLIKDLRKQLGKSTGANYLKLTKRIRAAEAFRDSGNKPSWMVLDCVPVMPPDLRPMVQLEGGRFATSDLNDLYRRVINRNNRLKRLKEIGAPNMIVRNEKRMLQEAVDVLFDNGKRGREVTGTNGRPLRSISDIIEGKQGRFRQNLLGKRVDYSGRSVIVVGPSLKLHQCGLPKEMAIELFKPFIIRELVKTGNVQNVKSAKRKIDNKEVIVYDVLDKVIKGHPVMLNRAPTLHRLGIQAFEPVLVEGKAIQIHPLVCAAFNADFDGDQMAVHVPLSLEAQAECRMLLLSSNNILSSSNGNPIITPTQDMILGIYWMTVQREPEKVTPSFADINEALKAYGLGLIKIQQPIDVMYDGQKILTTIGKIIFNTTVNEVLEHFGKEKIAYLNEQIGKKYMSRLISKWYDAYGATVTAELCDRLKNLGFYYAMRSGISIAIDDMVVPGSDKAKIIERGEKEQMRIDKQLDSEELTDREAKEKSHDLWRRVTAGVTDDMKSKLGTYNSVWIMANSGARGNIDQVRQLSAMRGLMADAQGNTVDIPIKTNFYEGLSLTEYFISAYGARKGLVDTALRTADSGYLTRRLVDIAQDVIITEEDCGTSDGMMLGPVKDGLNELLALEERLVGRNAAETVKDPITGEELVKKNQEITASIAHKIADAGIEAVKVRSILTCRAKRGICQKCYGRNLSTRRSINIGEAVGVIAAQSIGEPGTQLTMRTFHTGGVDLTKVGSSNIKAKLDGTVEFDESVKQTKIENDNGEKISIVVRECKLALVRAKGSRQNYDIPAGAEIKVRNGQKVKAGDVLAEYLPNVRYVIAVNEGIVDFHGFAVKERIGKSGRKEFTAKKDGELFVHNPEVFKEYRVDGDKEIYVEKDQRVKNDDEIATGIVSESAGRVLDVVDNGDHKIVRLSPGENYPIQAGSHLYFNAGEKVKLDEVIALESSVSEGSARDIVAGLPRVEELFEARHPKRAAVLSEVAGVAEIAEQEGKRIVTIIAGKSVKKKYSIPFGIRLKVFPGKHVQKGEPLTEGVKDPHDVISILGKEAAQGFIVNEVQKVYLSQGVTTNDKHIEVIVKQMTKKVRIREIGDSDYLVDDFVDVFEYEDVVKRLKTEDKAPPVGDEVLLGLTKASLNTESYISAASFQETTSVLTKAAVNGNTDPMYGLKENVIIGKLIPAGTGLSLYDNVRLTSVNPEVSLEPAPLTLEEEVFKL
ncbi:DNA-directed RNA polymerase subunit beta' [Candidatus Termititenax persephonae]|uniref:DNA-directed RNA polymerase subunit beta' n=1 Tax=Candidatus Termititenax persephonae TaxID=2218525 RepID=A0A388TFN8_9BACT|nr:DNA-directed RNA polymerase subunit beta' [Candidatus Termititenax persephonae]